MAGHSIRRTSYPRLTAKPQQRRSSYSYTQAPQQLTLTILTIPTRGRVQLREKETPYFQRSHLSLVDVDVAPVSNNRVYRCGGAEDLQLRANEIWCGFPGGSGGGVGGRHPAHCEKGVAFSWPGCLSFVPKSRTPNTITYEYKIVSQ